ncbi:hypothetical protein RH915_02735 [Serpentinicella sp. ANB-PHB4]|uniref:hypothetical protein n=1 Tax=Serpentinicella sp. ANB-PHB4 TaxID=3074076 RepID=UPI002860366C|nr:hypothetical protein [Serpentinicella sp. ANB-PHB4]MDR5658397.1 hypothetical protein [Serpentinicella sp. ANB-PHB4]
MFNKKGWIIGNILIGIGAISSFLYILFGVFWTNPNLISLYIGAVALIFIVFNFVLLKEHKISYWIGSFLIMISSAGVTYLLHGIFVLNKFL